MSPGAWSGFSCSQASGVVRVAPLLIARERRRGRRHGKSDRIDALAAARAAVAEPGLPAARLEGRERELALLVDYREQLVCERARSASRLRWLRHELGLGIEIPAGGLDRHCWLERLEHALAAQPEGTLVLISRALLARLRELREQIISLERQLQPLVETLAAPLLTQPGCGLLTRRQDHRRPRTLPPARPRLLHRPPTRRKTRREALRCLKTPPRPRRLSHPQPNHHNSNPGAPKLDIGVALQGMPARSAGMLATPLGLGVDLGAEQERQST